MSLASALTTQPYIFQFSLFDNEAVEVLLKKKIERLGGEVDDSPVSAHTHTHTQPSPNFLHAIYLELVNFVKLCFLHFVKVLFNCSHSFDRWWCEIKWEMHVFHSKRQMDRNTRLRRRIKSCGPIFVRRPISHIKHISQIVNRQLFHYVTAIKLTFFSFPIIKSNF